jgi:hypothetical protein
MSSKNVSHSKLIRALGFKESLYDQETLSGNFILPVVFLVDVGTLDEAKITIELLKKAANIWVEKNELLKAKIWRPNQDLDSTRYFVCSDSSELNNIRFEENESSDAWKELMEIEMRRLFDFENGPLWRIRTELEPLEPMGNQYPLCKSTSRSLLACASLHLSLENDYYNVTQKRNGQC